MAKNRELPKAPSESAEGQPEQVRQPEGKKEAEEKEAEEQHAKREAQRPKSGRLRISLLRDMPEYGHAGDVKEVSVERAERWALSGLAKIL